MAVSINAERGFEVFSYPTPRQKYISENLSIGTYTNTVFIRHLIMALRIPEQSFSLPLICKEEKRLEFLIYDVISIRSPSEVIN